MSEQLTGINITVIGGDERELVLIKELIKQGALVKVVGFQESQKIEGSLFLKNLKIALEDTDTIILPMPGTDENGVVRAVYSDEKLIMNSDNLNHVKPNIPIFIGVAKPYMHNLAKKHSLKLIEIAELNEVAILNSIPTAEGAIQIAMEELPITIHGSNSLVLGFGRCGFTLARMLQAIGSKVYVACRKASDIARCKEMGFIPITYENLAKHVGEMDLIINTVPFLIIDKNILNYVNLDTLIIDIAAAPGGTDFSAAEELGIKAILAPGLPGKVAPKTAGKILAEIYPGLILQNMERVKGGVLE